MQPKDAKKALVVLGRAQPAAPPQTYPVSRTAMGSSYERLGLTGVEPAQTLISCSPITGCRLVRTGPMGPPVT
jgi:hypothetical protein